MLNLNVKVILKDLFSMAKHYYQYFLRDEKAHSFIMDFNFNCISELNR